MRGLLGLVLVAALLYSGYWFVTVNMLEEATEVRLAEARAQGWRLDFSGIETRGFPSRFDTYLTDLDIATPDGQIFWSTPFLQVFALAYRPTEVIAAFAPEQTVCVRSLCRDFRTEGMRASAEISAAGRQIKAATVETAALSVLDGGTEVLSADAGLAALREVVDRVHAEDAFLRLTGVELGEGLRAGFTPEEAQALPEEKADLVVDARLEWDSDILDFDARLRRLELRRGELDWGPLTAQAMGTIEIGPDGQPEGLITLRTAAVEEWVEALTSVGVLSPNVSGMAVGMLGAMRGEDGVVELPFSFGNGMMALGPIPLGPAPRFR